MTFVVVHDLAGQFQTHTFRTNEQKHLSLSCSTGCLATAFSLLASALATNNVKVEH